LGGRSYTTEELYRLEYYAGYKSTRYIGKKLKRTSKAIYSQLTRMGCSHTLITGKTVHKIEKETGFAQDTIRLAITQLNMHQPVVGNKTYLIGEVEQIIKFLKKWDTRWGSSIIGDTRHMFLRCSACGTDKRPHQKYGMCVRCAQRVEKQIIRTGVLLTPAQQVQEAKDTLFPRQKVTCSFCGNTWHTARRPLRYIRRICPRCRTKAYKHFGDLDRPDQEIYDWLEQLHGKLQVGAA